MNFKYNSTASIGGSGEKKVNVLASPPNLTKSGILKPNKAITIQSPASSKSTQAPVLQSTAVINHSVLKPIVKPDPPRPSKKVKISEYNLSLLQHLDASQMDQEEMSYIASFNPYSMSTKSGRDVAVEKMCGSQWYGVAETMSSDPVTGERFCEKTLAHYKDTKEVTWPKVAEVVSHRYIDAVPKNMRNTRIEPALVTTKFNTLLKAKQFATPYCNADVKGGMKKKCRHMIESYYGHIAVDARSTPGIYRID